MTLTRRKLLSMAAASALQKNLVQAQSADDKVSAARDLLCQALELLSELSTKEQVQQALALLTLSLDQHPGFGDAHYYRYLCLKRIKENPNLRDRSKAAAVSYHSEALQENRDPFTLAVPRVYQDLETIGDKWALVVGISRFQPDVGPDPLKCAAADATAFAELLRDPGIGRFQPKNVYCLTNEKATTAAIKARLNTIATKAKREDIVLVYISTHGSSRDDDIKQVSYLLTYDTDVTTKDDIFGSALPMVEISGIISTRCTAQRTVLIFDTCHSGESASAETLSTADVDRFRQAGGRYVLTSCEPDQRSYEDAEHGYFTSSLMARLSERRGCIRLADLFSKVQHDVISSVKSIGKRQRPVMFTSENASEVILGAVPGGANEQCIARISA